MLEVYLLGTPKVILNNQQLHQLVRWSIPIELLAFLITHPGRPHARSILANMFWPDLLEAQARQYLNTHISRLRQLIHSESISYFLTDKQTIEFNSVAPFYLDIADLEQYVALIKNQNGVEITALSFEMVICLQRAIELYRGDFMEGYYSEWCCKVRDELNEKYMFILEKLSMAHLARAEYSAALSTARQLTYENPLREDGHYILIQVNIQMGRVMDALAQYHRYEDIWRNELKLSPSERMKNLSLNLKGGRTNGQNSRY